jgi:hypothetical protein
MRRSKAAELRPVAYRPPGPEEITRFLEEEQTEAI